MSLRFFLVASALAPTLAACTANAAELLAGDCRAERATYTLKEDPAFTAGFVADRYVSDLYLFITSPTRTYWFAMGTSMGHGGSHISPIADPTTDAAPEDGPESLWGDDEEPGWTERDVIRAQLSFNAFAADLSRVGVPYRDTPAPAYLFFPGLTNVMWYATAALVAGEGYVTQDSMLPGMFVLTGCRQG